MGLGISVLIGLKAVAMFLIFSYLRSFGFMLLTIPFLYASLVSFLVSIASLPSVNLPMLLAKGSDGSFPIWALIMFSPYLYFVQSFSALRRLCSGEAPYTEICDGLYVGGWPSSPDKFPPGNPAVIDCTCEFPKMEFVGNSYFCVPTWDTRSPQPGEIESAAKWACRKRDQNRPVLVHCAYGMILDSYTSLLICICSPTDYRLLVDGEYCFHVCNDIHCFMLVILLLAFYHEKNSTADIGWSFLDF